MSQSKSPLDELFYSIYGYYPKKAGQAYELLVNASLKIISNQNVKYDQRLRGNYSETSYQLDGLNIDKNQMIEAKDYTINNRKVGRSDLQKLQGALSDLEVNSGLFASATDYTSPAKKYAQSGIKNPKNKEIDLFHIRESVEKDEDGRIKSIHIDFMITLPNYENGKFLPKFTNNAINDLTNNFLGQEISLNIQEFYNKDGTSNMTMKEFSHNNQPVLKNITDEIADGFWNLKNKYIKYANTLYELEGIEYSIPFIHTNLSWEIESDGNPKIFIKSEDGLIDKLITDKQLKELNFQNGEILNVKE